MLDPIKRGVILAVLAALFFGVSTPLIQWFGSPLGPFTTAALICMGVASASLVSSILTSEHPPLTLRYAPRLIFVSVLGVAIAPALLAYGLARANGIAACLVLNMETVFTAFIGIVLYRERIGWRFAVGISSITCAAFLLVSDTATRDTEGVAGLLAVALATLAGSLDNALSRPLAEFDASEVLFAKGTVGAIVAAGLALTFEEAPDSRFSLVAVFLVGFIGYGGTERFYLLAQRALGVARTSSLFAVSPFFGAALALCMGAPAGFVWALAGVVMAIGVYLHATDHIEVGTVHRRSRPRVTVKRARSSIPPSARSTPFG